MFIACANRIKVFKIHDNGELDSQSEKIEDIVISEEKVTNINQSLSTKLSQKINQIKVGEFQNQEVLAVVDMSEKISVVQLKEQPFLINQYEYS